MVVVDAPRPLGCVGSAVDPVEQLAIGQAAAAALHQQRAIIIDPFELAGGGLRDAGARKPSATNSAVVGPTTNSP